MNGETASLGERIKVLRNHLGMSQSGLAERAHVTQATISLLENRHLQGIASYALADIAGALGTTTDYLLGRADSVSFYDLRDSGAVRLVQRYLAASEPDRRRMEEAVQGVEPVSA